MTRWRRRVVPAGELTRPGVPARLGQAREALAATARDRRVLGAQLSFAASFAAEWAVTVAIAVVAYADGGAAAVGVVGALRTLPAVVLVPLAGVLADRFPRHRVLVVINLLGALTAVGAATLLITGAPLVAVYALTVVKTILFTFVRPVQSALLPALCTTPRALTGAHVVRGLLDSVSALVGPLLAAALLAVSSPAAVFVAAAALAAASAVLVRGSAYETMRARSARAPVLREAIDGGMALLGRHRPRTLTLLLAAQTATRGALNVLVVVVAIEVLDLGEAGVGVLTAAVGVGAVAGSLGVLVVGAGRRLALLMGAGVALWGLPLAVAGALPAPAVVLLALGVVGAANALCDVGYYTLVARLVPDELLGRAMGTSESLVVLGVATGSLVTPALIEVLGVRGALVAVGLVAPTAVLLAWRTLHRIDAGIVVRNEEVDALQHVGMLGPLPVTAIDHLAERAIRVDAPAGTAIVREGEAGDRFYVVVAGEADVVRGGAHVRALGPGDGFGEIALLRDVPRTATVTARTPVQLLALERRHFLPVVSAFSASRAEADGTVDGHLRRDRDVATAGAAGQTRPMSDTDFGREGDVGGATQGDRDTDLGGSHSGGDGGDAMVVGDGQATRKGGNPLSEEEVEQGRKASGGVPDDVGYGTRKTVGMDEDGAGMPDSSGPSGGS